MGAAEATRKPNLQPRTETDKKKEKNARNATEFLNSIDLGKVWPPLVYIADEEMLNGHNEDVPPHPVLPMVEEPETSLV